MRTVSSLAALAAITLVSWPAFAQRDATTGEALFRAGRAAADKGDFSAACPKFEESNRLDPALGTVFNLADCDEHIGKIATAWQLFKEVAQRLPSGDDRIGIANARAAALEPRMPKLVLKVKTALPSGTTVLRDGVELGNASFDLPIPIDPGDHVILVKSPGRAEREFLTRANVGQTSEVALDVGPVAVAPPPSSSSATADTGVKSSSSNGRNALGISLLVLGGAGIATSLATGAVALSAKNTVQNGCDVLRTCTDDALAAADRGKTAANISTVAFTVGLVGTAAGIFVLLLNKGDAKSAAAAAHPPVDATLVPGGAFLSVKGRVW
jgi:hypothetical protein